MKSRLAAAAIALALGLVAVISSPSISSVAAQTISEQTAMRTTVFTIENMTCALCPVTVKRAMEGVEGVRTVDMDFDTKTATVVFDPSSTTADAIGTASTNAGYPAEPTG